MQETAAPMLASVLFVDDETPILNAIARFSRGKGWQLFVAKTPQQALDIASKNDIDVVVSDMRMPGMSGSELLNEFKQKWPLTVRILLTGYSDIHALESAINESHIYNYLTKPWDENTLTEVIHSAIEYRQIQIQQKQEQIKTKQKATKLSKLALLLNKQVAERTMETEQALLLLQRAHNKNSNALLDSVTIINRILEWKGGHAHGHSEFVTHYAVKMAEALNFSDTDIELVRISALLHRVGMLALPSHLRKKPLNLLTAEEKKIYQQHPLWGERCIAYSNNLTSVARVVRHHREFVNGNGYPDGLIDKEIPTAAKIIGLVSDFYDAFAGQISPTIRGLEPAKVYIHSWTGKRHDTQLTSLFMSIISDFKDTAITTRILFTQDIKPGMILDDDLKSKNGTLLLTAGNALTQEQITKIKAHEISSREVFEITVRESTTRTHNPEAIP